MKSVECEGKYAMVTVRSNTFSPFNDFMHRAAATCPNKMDGVWRVVNTGC